MAYETLTASGHAVEFVKDQFRHCKPMFAIGSGVALLAAADIPPALPTGEPDPGLVVVDADAIDAGVASFVAALTQRRHFEREVDPPAV